MPLDQTLKRIHAQTMNIRSLVMGTSPVTQESTERDLGVDTLIHELDVTICFLRTARDVKPGCNLL